MPLTPDPRVPSARRLVPGLLLLLVGCGPTHTAGTRGLARQDLAVLSVPQLPKITHLRLETVRFDGDAAAYPVGTGRDFYLLPRDRTATFTLRAVLPVEVGFLGALLSKDDLTFPAPTALPLGPLAAGHAYELTAPTDGFDKLLDTGRLAFVREKDKAK